MLLEDWMRVVIDTCGFYVSNIMHNLDGCLSFFESETLSSKCFLINQRVEIGESSTEFDLFTIERDTAVSALPFGADLSGNIVDVDREEPGYSGPSLTPGSLHRLLESRHGPHCAEPLQRAK